MHVGSVALDCASHGVWSRAIVQKGVTVATLADIAAVHRMTATTESDPIYDNTLVGTYIDNLGSNEAAAAAIWGEKAAAASVLVDTAESGSSRSLSQLQRQALAMQQHFMPDDPTPAESGGSFTVAITRP